MNESMYLEVEELEEKHLQPRVSALSLNLLRLGLLTVISANGFDLCSIF